MLQIDYGIWVGESRANPQRQVATAHEQGRIRSRRVGQTSRTLSPVMGRRRLVGAQNVLFCMAMRGTRARSRCAGFARTHPVLVHISAQFGQCPRNADSSKRDGPCSERGPGGKGLWGIRGHGEVDAAAALSPDMQRCSIPWSRCIRISSGDGSAARIGTDADAWGLSASQPLRMHCLIAEMRHSHKTTLSQDRETLTQQSAADHLAKGSGSSYRVRLITLSMRRTELLGTVGSRSRR